MKTWLDAYIAQQDREYEPSLRNHPKYGSRSPIKIAHWNLVIQDKWDDPLESFDRELTEGQKAFFGPSLQEYELDRQKICEWPEDIRKTAFESMARLEREWVYMITPFLQQGPYAPLCLQITPDLAHFFADKRVEGWDSEAFNLLERHKSIYIDLPPDTFYALPHLQIRAIMIRDMRHTVKVTLDPKKEGELDRNWGWHYVEDPQGVIRVSAIITPRGSNREEGAIRWTLFSEEPAEGFTLEADDFNYDVFRSQLEEFIKVVLAYFLLAPRKSQRHAEPIDLENADRKERRAWEKDKQTTLFSLVQLGMTSDQNAIVLAGGLRGSRKGWKLGVRIHIEPFERWQWKGKKGERYKEKVIVGDREGKDGQKGFWKGPADAPLRLKLFSLS